MKDEDVDRLMRLFRGYGAAHGTHGEPRQKPDSLKWEIKSTARTLREPVTRELWIQHLAGKRPLGIITIKEDGTCDWGGIDFDVYDADLLELVERVQALKLPLVPCRSKSGGLHLFLFLKEPAIAAEVMASLRDMAAQIGIAGSEIYPKQVGMLAERGDLGNWIVMPYFGGTFDGKLQEQVGLRKDGSELSLTAFIRECERAAIAPEELGKFTRKRESAPKGRGRKIKGGGSSHEPDQPFGDGPPCLQTLAADKVQKGFQNNALLMMGIYLKRKYPVEWPEELEKAAREYLDPPGSAEGTASVKRSLEKKDYDYTCRTEPMCSHCSVAICRTRMFGIGEEGDYPSIASLSKLATDPPVYFIDVGDRRVEVSSATLMVYSAFNQACIDQIGRVFAPMAQKDWTMALKEAADRMVLIDAPPESSRMGTFFELLEEFCTNKLAGDKLEDLFSGRPALVDEEKRYALRIRDLSDYLVRMGVKDMGRGYITQRLMDLKAEPFQTTVKGKHLRGWYVAAERLEKMPELETPAKKESPI